MSSGSEEEVAAGGRRREKYVLTHSLAPSDEEQGTSSPGVFRDRLGGASMERPCAGTWRRPHGGAEGVVRVHRVAELLRLDRITSGAPWRRTRLRGGPERPKLPWKVLCRTIFLRVAELARNHSSPHKADEPVVLYGDANATKGAPMASAAIPDPILKARVAAPDWEESVSGVAALIVASGSQGRRQGCVGGDDAPGRKRRRLPDMRTRPHCGMPTAR